MIRIIYDCKVIRTGSLDYVFKTNEHGEWRRLNNEELQFVPLTYRERKIRRNMLTTNAMQGEVRCCQICGKRRKREENHMSGP